MSEDDVSTQWNTILQEMGNAYEAMFTAAHTIENHFVKTQVPPSLENIAKDIERVSQVELQPILREEYLVDAYAGRCTGKDEEFSYAILVDMKGNSYWAQIEQHRFLKWDREEIISGKQEFIIVKTICEDFQFKNKYYCSQLFRSRKEGAMGCWFSTWADKPEHLRKG